ncbi:MAG: PrsW family intramembrane metalloprotease [Treponema sp.]|jgi:RsiW-degrading membrane proteinase PrsW (M82 family)|nr:PrsW family intramembrane metalloprotease [Treponema sp.]
MTGIGILVLLIFISALPILPVFIWFRVIRFPLGPWWILGFLAAGAAALVLAGFLQTLFPPLSGIDKGTLFFKLFVQIALTEEGGRLLLLLVLLQFMRRFLRRFLRRLPEVSLSLGAAGGLLTGLGFAVIETAAYGASDPGAALLRTFTAVPLHGACGSRVGLAAASLPRSPFRALMFFFYAIVIHGMYNFMVISPGLPLFFPIILVFSALFSSIQTIRRGVDRKIGAGQEV